LILAGGKRVLQAFLQAKQITPSIFFAQNIWYKITFKSKSIGKSNNGIVVYKKAYTILTYYATRTVKSFQIPLIIIICVQLKYPEWAMK
jgi:hypothetical protein